MLSSPVQSFKKFTRRVSGTFSLKVRKSSVESEAPRNINEPVDVRFSVFQIGERQIAKEFLQALFPRSGRVETTETTNYEFLELETQELNALKFNVSIYPSSSKYHFLSCLLTRHRGIILIIADANNANCSKEVVELLKYFGVLKTVEQRSFLVVLVGKDSIEHQKRVNSFLTSDLFISCFRHGTMNCETFAFTNLNYSPWSVREFIKKSVKNMRVYSKIVDAIPKHDDWLVECNQELGIAQDLIRSGIWNCLNVNNNKTFVIKNSTKLFKALNLLICPENESLSDEEKRKSYKKLKYHDLVYEQKVSQDLYDFMFSSIEDHMKSNLEDIVKWLGLIIEREKESLMSLMRGFPKKILVENNSSESFHVVLLRKEQREYNIKSSMIFPGFFIQTCKQLFDYIRKVDPNMPSLKPGNLLFSFNGKKFDFSYKTHDSDEGSFATLLVGSSDEVDSSMFLSLSNIILEICRRTCSKYFIEHEPKILFSGKDGMLATSEDLISFERRPRGPEYNKFRDWYDGVENIKKELQKPIPSFD